MPGSHLGVGQPAFEIGVVHDAFVPLPAPRAPAALAEVAGPEYSGVGPGFGGPGRPRR